MTNPDTQTISQSSSQKHIRHRHTFDAETFKFTRYMPNHNNAYIHRYVEGLTPQHKP